MSFNKFSDVLLACTCTGATCNLQSICLGGNILSCIWSETLAAQAKSEGHPFPFVDFNGNIPL